MIAGDPWQEGTIVRIKTSDEGWRPKPVTVALIYFPGNRHMTVSMDWLYKFPYPMTND
jgi:hypothetical protein